MLQPVLRGGRRVGAPPSLEQIRAHAADQLVRLPEKLRRLQSFAYPVESAADLRALAVELDRAEVGNQAASP